MQGTQFYHIEYQRYHSLHVNKGHLIKWQGSMPFTQTFSFDFSAIFDTELYFHLVMIIMHLLAMLATQLNRHIIFYC